MKQNGGNKMGVAGRVVRWLNSSAFAIAGTVLLICWLLADVIEPGGGFASVGLILAIAAYVVDLAREERRSGPEKLTRTPQRLGFKKT